MLNHRHLLGLVLVVGVGGIIFLALSLNSCYSPVIVQRIITNGSDTLVLHHKPEKVLAPISAYHLEPIHFFEDNVREITTFEIVDSSRNCDVALTLALSSAGETLDASNFKTAHLIKEFFPTLHPTLTEGYWYCIYFGVDDVDPFYAQPEGQKLVTDHIREWAKTNKVAMTHVVWSLVPYTKHSAWAHNDAVMTAHRDGINWFYRVNDDTIYETKNWTGRFIEELNKLDRIGVVGPTHQGGNLNILTYDFTHRTHIYIYGFHWPRAFPNWYGDEWISKNYEPSGRKIKLADVKLKHLVHPSRYFNKKKKTDPGALAGVSQAVATKKTCAILEEYLECRKTKSEYLCRNFDYISQKIPMP